MDMRFTFAGLLMIACVGCKADSPRHVDLPPPATSSAEPQESCLMWYVCNCNLGCSKLVVPRSDLKDGLRAEVVSGTEKGKTGYVFQDKDKSGNVVFALSPDKPGSPEVCDYRCEVSKSGTLDPHKCDTACN